ncbi:MAG: beta-propeller domain-containing protein [Burkholderiales bacterium]|nr:beta-propeller domain-containing protein [Burkholderiales bacterium]
MFTRRLALNCSLALLAATSLPGCAAPEAGPATPSRTLKPYASEAELAEALERWRGQAARQQAERRAQPSMAMQSAPAPMAAPAAPAAPAAMAKSAEGAATAADSAAAESITNVQTAGVDEGGIVKRAGDHLVILRRGRLFTVRVGGDTLQPAATLDAFAPQADPRGAWYDELLVSGNTVVVVGYSYARGGTEIGLFELGEGGTLAYRATYHLRSFDYYSARNYASRLIGRKLVFYSPTLLQPWGPPPAQMMPGVRRWHGPSTPPEFERILPATRIYRTDDEFDPGQPLALHTVTACELGAGALRCESTAVLGPAGRVFYVSQGSVYVWTTTGARRPPPAAPGAVPAAARAQSAVFRIPLDGAAPSGLKTAGVPVDQMSFLEDGRGHLNVLLQEAGMGEAMWGSERAGGGRMALLRVPLAAFGDGRGSAQREHYRMLPALAGWGLQNRFIGDWLLWGAGGGARRAVPPVAEMNSGAPMPPPQQPAAWALQFADPGSLPHALDPGHAVERIEAMGSHAVLVGNAGADLHFSAVRLGRGAATLAGQHVQPGARQGETRTHGFFFRPTAAEEGLLGLPVLGGGGRRTGGVYAGGQGSAAVMFLRQRALAFQPLGELAARAVTQDDACRASCVDWYGNARPLFLGERVFALLGYELVEGRLDGRGGSERIDERRRVSFAPTLAARDGRYSPFN